MVRTCDWLEKGEGNREEGTECDAEMWRKEGVYCTGYHTEGCAGGKQGVRVQALHCLRQNGGCGVIVCRVAGWYC